MTQPGEQPLLFLDVDGTVVPFGQGSGPVADVNTGDSYLARVDPQTGLRLAALPCELVWATTWEDHANTEGAPQLGLPPLPVVHWSEPSIDDVLEDQWFDLHWKTRTLVKWAAGRPFAWVDDEIKDSDMSWVASNHHGHALLHQVEASKGLTDQDLEALTAWLRENESDPKC